MPDIFVNSDTPEDLGGNAVAGDPMPKAHRDIKTTDHMNDTSQTQPIELTPLTPQNPHEALSNSHKHALKSKELEHLPGHTHNMLASFFYYPDRVDFVNKDPQEIVILMVRRHPITNFPWILISFILIIAPAFLSVLPFFETIPSNFQLVFGIMWYMFTTAFILEKFLSWFFNVNIVTDERIIDVDFLHLLYREMTDADIEQIQDVTVEMAGTIRTVFNYGDVLIQTASNQSKTKFEAIPHPDRVAKILRELRVEEQEEKAEGRVR